MSPTFGEQSREEKVKDKMTDEVNPKAYPLAEQVCFKIQLTQ